jgi:hypothetical protein
MRRVGVPLLLFVFPAVLWAGELPIRYADTGEDFVADVEAVLGKFSPQSEQLEKIEKAKKGFTESRDKLLADLIEKFTEAVGEPDKVFAAVEAEDTLEEEKKGLEEKIEKFASIEGRKFRSAVTALQSRAKLEISRFLGKDSAKFTLALTRRQVAKAMPLGRYALRLEDIAGTLNLDAQQKKAFDELTQSLKDRQQSIIKEYQESYVETMGSRDAIRKIMTEGTTKERTSLSKKINEFRKAMEEENRKKADDAIRQFEKDVKQLLSEEQQQILEELTKSGK